jgi:hypothetical protein
MVRIDRGGLPLRTGRFRIRHVSMLDNYCRSGPGRCGKFLRNPLLSLVYLVTVARKQTRRKHQEPASILPRRCAMPFSAFCEVG